ncbi:hypothetical protein LP419_14605 [Massilia sp. H-1]|nr:hypothetical protein LP419_14605 [Massilia sp. H-1]
MLDVALERGRLSGGAGRRDLPVRHRRPGRGDELDRAALLRRAAKHPLHGRGRGARARDLADRAGHMPPAMPAETLLPPQAEAGRQILAAVNRARAG